MAGGQRPTSPRSGGPLAMETNMGKTLHGTLPKWNNSTRCWSSRLFRSFTIETRKGCHPDGSNASARAWPDLPPEFSASRAIREYTNDHYLPAAAGYERRAPETASLAPIWSSGSTVSPINGAHCGSGTFTSETRDGQHRFKIRDRAWLTPCRPVPSGTLCGANHCERPQSRGHPCVRTLADPSGTLLYSVCCPATRPADDYTARVVPAHAGALVPLEASQILWQR